MRSERGQALVEWVVFGSAVLILWTVSMQLATRLLARASVDTWSMLGARHALSNASTHWNGDMKLKKRSGKTLGQATAHLDGSRAALTIEVPRNRDRSFWESFSSGFQSSPSSR